MITQSRFQKNSAYDKYPAYDDEGNWIKDQVSMFKGIVDIAGKVYDGEIFREVEYGKEVFVLCLTMEDEEALF
jgi:hypothetical protein